MPRASRRTKLRATPRGKPNAGSTISRQRKSGAKTKRKRRMLNGIPLKRTVIWTYDTDSPEFKAAWERDIRKIRSRRVDAELEQFLEDAWQDINRALGDA